MAEHDFIIDNGTGSAVRTDLNNLFQAIASNNSKSGALTTNYASQWHVDTSDGNLKIRNAANNGHIESGYTWKITAHGADSDTANNTNDNKIRLTNQTYLGANTNEGFNMIIDFMSPNSTTVPTMAFWKISGSSQSDTLAVQEGGSRRNDGTEAHTGFILFFDSGGDFDSFNYQFYGLDKS